MPSNNPSRMRNFILAILLIFSNYLQSQITNAVELIEGSDKPLKIEYKQSVTITYQNHIVIINKNEEEIGERIVLVNRRTGEKSRVTDYDEECLFVGLYNNTLFFSCGTDVIRSFLIYNINTSFRWEVNEGVLSAIIKGNKLVVVAQVSEERKKRFRLKDGACNTQICGYFENIFYNLDTKQKEYSGKFKWID